MVAHFLAWSSFLLYTGIFEGICCCKLFYYYFIFIIGFIVLAVEILSNPSW